MENKIHYIGASSMWAWQFAKSLYTSDIKGYKRFVSMQNLYNLLYREEEREMIPLCKSEKIALIPWSPTARGFLSGRFFKNGKLVAAENNKSQQAVGSNAFNLYVGRQENDQIVRRVLELASNKQVKPAQIAIAWLFTKEVTAPIVGTSKVDHLEEFVESLDVKITADESRYLEEPYVPQPVFGHN
jgi:aryl-alcohol dehydrogenase-like predicted oxidoreductase